MYKQITCSKNICKSVKYWHNLAVNLQGEGALRNISIFHCIIFKLSSLLLNFVYIDVIPTFCLMSEIQRFLVNMILLCGHNYELYNSVKGFTIIFVLIEGLYTISKSLLQEPRSFSKSHVHWDYLQGKTVQFSVVSHDM